MVVEQSPNTSYEVSQLAPVHLKAPVPFYEQASGRSILFFVHNGAVCERNRRCSGTGTAWWQASLRNVLLKSVSRLANRIEPIASG